MFKQKIKLSDKELNLLLKLVRTREKLEGNKKIDTKVSLAAEQLSEYNQLGQLERKLLDLKYEDSEYMGWL